MFELIHRMGPTVGKLAHKAGQAIHAAGSRLLLGVGVFAVSALFMNVFLAACVFRDPSGFTFAPTASLAIRLAWRGFAPPVQLYMQWAVAFGWWGFPAWILTLVCAERWGALCEAARIGLVRLGMTSRPPAQTSAGWIKACRISLAFSLCAFVVVALALAHGHVESRPLHLAEEGTSLGLAWGPAARWLWDHGMLP